MRINYTTHLTNIHIIGVYVRTYINDIQLAKVNHIAPIMNHLRTYVLTYVRR